MRDRKQQRMNRRKKHYEEMLETHNSYGYKDLTPYAAVLNMKNKNKNTSRLPSETKAAFLCPKSAEGGEQDG